MASFVIGHPAAAAPATQVSTGAETACAVVNYRAKCWGNNSNGQLGNGSFSNSTTPVDVIATGRWTETIPAHQECSFFVICQDVPAKQVDHPGTGLGGKSVTRISVSSTHACAVANAAVYCWGKNSDGQLGTRSNSSSREPVAVDTASGVKKTCTKYAKNGKTCLQYNVSSDKPASALRDKEVIDVSVGDSFSCALASDGSVACWGSNGSGQLGIGNRDSKNYPVAVALGGTKIKKLATLKGTVDTMCVIATDDRALCWGENYAGQTGNGDTINNGYGAGSGHVQLPNDTQCRLATERAFQQAQVETIPETPSDVLVPNNVATNQRFSDIIVWGDSGEKNGVLPSDALPNAGKVRNWSESASYKGYAHVTGLTTSASSSSNRAFYWGGSVDYEYYAACKSNRGGGNGGESHGTGDRAVADVRFSYVFSGVSTPVGPVYTAGSTPLTNRALAKVSGNAYPAGDYVHWFCAAPSNTSGEVACDDHKETCNTTGSALGDAILKAKGQWRCTQNGPKTVPSNGVLQSISALDTGYSNYTCAITGGKVGCWGENGSGQLGVGDRNDRTAPTAVVGL